MGMQCPNLAVSPVIMQHIINVESSGNPYAIGVVNGRLKRQPRNLEEALATVKALEDRGFNFSLGIAQVNRFNLKPYGIQSYRQAFQICPNIQAGSKILKECYDRAQHWGKAFSCYYSGNFTTGYRHGYVQKIEASMKKAQGEKKGQVSPIAIIDNRQSASVSKKRRFAVNNLKKNPMARFGGRVAGVQILNVNNSSKHENEVRISELTPKVHIDSAFVF